MQLQAANERLAAKEQELTQAQDRIRELEAKQKEVEVRQPEQEHTWGDSSWGSNAGWGNSDSNTPKTYEEEKIW